MKVEQSTKQGVFENGYTHIKEFDSLHLHHVKPLYC